MDDNRKPITIVVIGKVGAGKSSVGNMMLNEMSGSQNGFDVSPPDTPMAGAETKIPKIRLRSADVEGRKLEVFDTPGYLDADEENEYHQLAWNEAGMVMIEKLKGSIDIFALVLDATDDADKSYRSAELFGKLYGKEAMRYVVFVFTHVDQIEDFQRRNIDEKFSSLGGLVGFSVLCEFVNASENDNANRPECITQLMKQVKSMISYNNGCVYTITEFKKAQLRYIQSVLQISLHAPTTAISKNLIPNIISQRIFSVSELTDQLKDHRKLPEKAWAWWQGVN